MSECGCDSVVGTDAPRRALIILLAINAAMFVIEFGAGVVAESTGLIADSLDMLADAAVYGAALYVIGRSMIAKANAATVTGIVQIALAMGVAVDVVRRSLVGSDPGPALMMGVGLLALLANVACLVIISRYRDGEVHLRASYIFSKNDVLANGGVILGGGLVWLLDSPIPDLAIGAVITIIVLRGGALIIRDAMQTRREVLDS